MFHHFPSICLWPLGNGYYLKQNTGRTIFLCLPSLLFQSTFWKFATARLCSFRFNGHHSLLYTFGSIILYLKIIYLEDKVKLCCLNSMYIVPLPFDPHERQQSSVFNSLSYHLWALFKVLHIRVKIRNGADYLWESGHFHGSCVRHNTGPVIFHTHVLFFLLMITFPLNHKPKIPPSSIFIQSWILLDQMQEEIV